MIENMEPKNFSSLPLRGAAGMVLGVALAFAVSFASVSSASTTTTSVKPAPPSQVLPSQAAFPAYQHIPFTGYGITVSLVDVASNGKFILEVFSQTRTLAQTRVAYKKFLRRYRDPGTKYIPRFASVLNCTPQTC